MSDSPPFSEYLATGLVTPALAGALIQIMLFGALLGVFVDFVGSSGWARQSRVMQAVVTFVILLTTTSTIFYTRDIFFYALLFEPDLDTIIRGPLTEAYEFVLVGILAAVVQTTLAVRASRLVETKALRWFYLAVIGSGSLVALLCSTGACVVTQSYAKGEDKFSLVLYEQVFLAWMFSSAGTDALISLSYIILIRKKTKERSEVATGAIRLVVRYILQSASYTTIFALGAAITTAATNPNDPSQYDMSYITWMPCSVLYAFSLFTTLGIADKVQDKLSEFKPTKHDGEDGFTSFVSHASFRRSRSPARRTALEGMVTKPGEPAWEQRSTSFLGVKVGLELQDEALIHETFSPSPMTALDDFSQRATNGLIAPVIGGALIQQVLFGALLVVFFDFVRSSGWARASGSMKFVLVAVTSLTAASTAMYARDIFFYSLTFTDDFERITRGPVSEAYENLLVGVTAAIVQQTLALRASRLLASRSIRWLYLLLIAIGSTLSLLCTIGACVLNQAWANGATSVNFGLSYSQLFEGWMFASAATDALISLSYIHLIRRTSGARNEIATSVLRLVTRYVLQSASYTTAAAVAAAITTAATDPNDPAQYDLSYVTWMPCSALYAFSLFTTLSIRDRVRGKLSEFGLQDPPIELALPNLASQADYPSRESPGRVTRVEGAESKSEEVESERQRGGGSLLDIRLTFAEDGHDQLEEGGREHSRTLYEHSDSS